MKNDFIPSRDTDFISLERNFIAKLIRYSEELGISSEDAKDTLDILKRHSASFTEMISKRAESKAATEYHIMNKKDAVKEFRRIAKLIKSSKRYSPEIGENLGIIGPEIFVKDSSILKPELKAIVNGSEVLINFRKERTNGIKIYSKRGNEEGFSPLDLASLSPYSDKRKKLTASAPERREYFAFFLKDFKETGLQSDIVTVTIP